MAYRPIQKAFILVMDLPVTHRILKNIIFKINHEIEHLNDAYDARYSSDWKKPYVINQLTNENSICDFFYNITLRGPMVFLGNLIVALLNMAIIVTFEIYGTEWKKNTLKAFVDFMHKAILINSVQCAQDIFCYGLIGSILCPLIATYRLINMISNQIKLIELDYLKNRNIHKSNINQHDSSSRIRQKKQTLKVSFNKINLVRTYTETDITGNQVKTIDSLVKAKDYDGSSKQHAPFIN